MINSKTAQPIYQLLKETDGQNKSSISANSWKDSQQAALNSFSLVEPPTLAYPNHNKELTLHVDVSGTGLEAILLQNQNNKSRVISYGIRSFTPQVKKHHCSKKWVSRRKMAVWIQFRDYLYYAFFYISIDNNPMTYITTTGKLTATGQRSVNTLAHFQFSLHYTPVVKMLLQEQLNSTP